MIQDVDKFVGSCGPSAISRGMRGKGSSEPYTGELAEIPGSDSPHRAAATGIESIPLAEVERIVGHASGAGSRPQ
ncbi:hypothetical protein ACWENA_17640 [Streptomyces sp. NPDC004779]